ncbi:hypothetical protein [Kitasatospora purpeofusca]|uniref:Uncharacterized protein n=1 Tax=Kitasatospora purpeofusca TaxID=67352 RepID=A0ABZ1U6J6_9ACTN|nr:hypothetical protein [Kitasatospora purpeofusca]
MSRRSMVPSAVADGTISLRWKRPISAALTLALIVPAGVAVDALAATSAAAAPSPKATEPPKPTAPVNGNEAPDEASALLSARLQGHGAEWTESVFGWFKRVMD